MCLTHLRHGINFYFTINTPHLRADLCTIIFYVLDHSLSFSSHPRRLFRMWYPKSVGRAVGFMFVLVVMIAEILIATLVLVSVVTIRFILFLGGSNL